MAKTAMKTFGCRCLLLVLSCLVCLVQAQADAEPESDFQGYMDSLKEREVEQQRRKEMLEQHEIWRRTTWAGWSVRQMQRIGNHLSPFILAVEEAMSSADEGPLQILVMMVLRSLMIVAFVSAAYAFARVVSSILGKEIVIEEEVVIEEEEEEPKKRPRRSARQKKTA